MIDALLCLAYYILLFGVIALISKIIYKLFKKHNIKIIDNLINYIINL